MSEKYDDIVSKFFETCHKETKEYMQKLGEEAVSLNKRNGNYHNRTGNLRRSNYYEIDESESGCSLVVGNKASYASKISSRGYDVVDSGIQYVRKELEGKV